MPAFLSRVLLMLPWLSISMGCVGRLTTSVVQPDFPAPDDLSAAVDLGTPPLSGDFVGTLGAIPYDGGVSFRVWAPAAEQVFVAGEITPDPNGIELSAADGGVFAGDVSGARPGQSYQYLIHLGGDKLVRQDPRARAVKVPKGPSLIVDPRFAWTSSSFVTPAAKAQVIYELHLGTFNPPAGTVAGNFATAMAKLDYLRALGINMIEVMPPAAFSTTTSWGYSPNFLYGIAQQYGTPDDLKRFVDAAHSHGIGVIIDVVYNHLAGSNQPLDCFDGDCDASSGDRGIYFYSDAARANTSWGPRPDYGRAEVRDYLRDNVLLWLSEYHCDGLRWDSVSNIRATENGGGPANPDGIAMITDIMNTVHMQFPHTIQIAEDLQTIDYITQATSAGGLGFDSQWDAAFFHPVEDNVITESDADRSMASISSAISHRYGDSPLERVVYSEDHDEVANGRSRIPEMISPGDAGSLIARQRSTLAAAIVLTAPGIPMIFMGQEFLESGHFSDTIPLDWSKVQSYSGILAEYRDLIALRKNQGGHTAGMEGANLNVFHLNEAAKVIAYHRWDQGGAGDDVVILANFSAKAFPIYTLGLPREGTWHVRFHSDAKSYSSDYADTPAADLVTSAATRDGFSQEAAMPLGAYETIILSQ